MAAGSIDWIPGRELGRWDIAANSSLLRTDPGPGHTQRGMIKPPLSRSQGGDMPDRILTSHAGGLPRPEELIALNGRRAAGELSARGETRN